MKDIVLVKSNSFSITFSGYYFINKYFRFSMNEKREITGCPWKYELLRVRKSNYDIRKFSTDLIIPIIAGIICIEIHFLFNNLTTACKDQKDQKWEYKAGSWYKCSHFHSLVRFMLLFNGFSVSNATSIKFDTNILHRGVKPL